MKNIAIVTGGDSSESVISVQSAEQVASLLDKSKYNLFVINIKGSVWELTSDAYYGIPIDKNDFSFTYNGQKTSFDAVFMALHGTPGEDGTLQAYFNMLKIPYTTCSLLTSALTFNKFSCNSYLRSLGVRLAKSVRIQKNQSYKVEEVLAHVGLPCFVKPNNGGSSFGTTKVTAALQLDEAIAKALKEDNEAIIEQFIQGREFTVGVFKTSEENIVFPVTEIISKNEFFDYESKYNPALADEVVPADLPENLAKKCQQISLEIYEMLNCYGICRIDYIMHNNEFYFLEINTVPGMTKNSIVPKQIKALNMSVGEVYGKLIDDAIKNKNYSK